MQHKLLFWHILTAYFSRISASLILNILLHLEGHGTADVMLGFFYTASEGRMPPTKTATNQQLGYSWQGLMKIMTKPNPASTVSKS